VNVDLLPLLEQVQAIARTGLHYANNAYDRERYEKLLCLVSEAYGQVLDLPGEEVWARLAADLSVVTPKVGADAAIFDAEGRILLMLRADNQKWCMPCGLVEAGEAPAKAAVREAYEETGLEVQELDLVGVFTRLPHRDYTPYTLVSVVYLCKVTGGTLRSSHEDLGLKYWPIDDVPIWHGQQEDQVRSAHAKWLSRQRVGRGVDGARA
jgi:ADP-ribose pyrophosphatase YjhB (NUDIX family)